MSRPCDLCYGVTIPHALSMRPTLLAGLLWALTMPAVAEVLPENLVQADVLPGWVTPEGRHMAGLRLRLAPGWKTYWRAPGAAGIPPEFHWDGSENIGAAALHWPVPHVFYQSGMRSIGYLDQVVIPIEVTPAAPGTPVRLAGTVDIGICHDICVPATVPFDVTLPGDGDRDPAIMAALIDRPMTADEAGVGPVTCTVRPDGAALRLTVAIAIPPGQGDEVIVAETSDATVWLSESNTWREGATLMAEVTAMDRSGGPVALNRDALRLTVIGDGRAVDIRGCAGG
jgi:DsbC/DsbD-like thiol-disulfide interchange protein